MSIKSDDLNKLVPMTLFSRGQAAKIFARLSNEKQLIVLKNANTIAILLSPDEFAKYDEAESRYSALCRAMKRLEGRGFTVEELLSEAEISDESQVE